MTKHSIRKLRVAHNNAHRKFLNLHIRCSASQMHVDNDLLNFEALIRKKTNSFIFRYTVSDNAVMKAFLDSMVARGKAWT